jgi:formyl-CoA transferase
VNKADFYRDARTDLPGPLAGIRVLEATTTVAGPVCCAVLADLGADVVKVEIPEGEIARQLPPLPNTDVSFIFAALNRNKRSLMLDVRRPEGRDIFLKLAAECDIVVENFKAGTMDQLGIGYSAAREVKPDVVYVSISGWGQFGPYRDRPAYDAIAQAASGFMSLNGSVDGPPTKAAIFLADHLAGLHGAIGALAALRHRDATGEGQQVDSALLDAILFQSEGRLTFAAMGGEMVRSGNRYSASAPTNVFECKDGSVYVMVVLDSHWKALAQAIGHQDLADDPEFATREKRWINVEACEALVGAWLAERTRAEAIEVLTRAGVAIAPVNTYAEAARDPQVLERDMLQATQLEDGSNAPLTGPA